MYSIRKISVVAAFAFSSAIMPSAAQASTVVNFPVNNNGTGNSQGRVYNVTVGTITVKVRVTAWSTAGTSNSSTVTKGAVQAYSNGLGVSSIGETSSSPHHTIDNYNKNKDFLIFQFDQPVELDSAKFTTYNMSSALTDGDATIGFGNTMANWQADLLAGTSSYLQLKALFGNSFAASNVTATYNQTSTTRSLNSANNVGNIWLIGSAFVNPVENGCKKSTGQVCFDGFKLSNVSVAVSAVPEPASWLMMILGFGFVGYSMRRRNMRFSNGALRFA